MSDLVLLEDTRLLKVSSGFVPWEKIESYPEQHKYYRNACWTTKREKNKRENSEGDGTFRIS